MTYSIPFMPCPIDKHHGEMWEKLQDLDLSEPVVIKEIDYTWSNQLPLQDIQMDTFHDFERVDWIELMLYFYKLPHVFGMMMTLEHYQKVFTTFRAYKPDTVRYYEERKELGSEMLLKVRR